MSHRALTVTRATNGELRLPARGAKGAEVIASHPWHARPAGEVISALQTAPGGLTPEEAARRLARWGPNAIRGRNAKPWWFELLESMTEPLQLLLLAVAALY